MTFGQKLKKLRNDNNLTQEQLADMIYVQELLFQNGKRTTATQVYTV